MTPGEWAAWATLAVYVVLAALAVIPIVQAKRARELQTRPYVIVDFEIRGFLLYLVIKNIGATPATDVSISFDQPLQSSLERDINAAAALTAPISMLAPGREVRLMFDSGLTALNDPARPRRYVATAVYFDHARRKKYEDPKYVLDLSPYEGTEIGEKGFPDLVNEVAKIRKEMHKWTDGIRGLRVHAVDRDRHESREYRRHLRSTGQHVRRDKGWSAYLRWYADRLLRRFGWRG